MEKQFHMLAIVNLKDEGGRNLEPSLVSFLTEWRYVLRLEAHHFILELEGML
jgi:hypothetical protein